MKRQGQAMGDEDGRKKSKRAVETKEGDGGVMAAECGLVCWEEEWAAEEQMPWASVWWPLWDLEYVDEAYGALFGDVAWDDDIWGLKTVMVIPQQ
ncbi:Ribulose bisphosphate carboxylase small chain 1A [Hibiscus syriacus]|uniref:Ribulose bisphosphate carboxylase small chain 1A n=1 Tax=Hibiscus syriacus TaxID=106335 RepID=A0A6A2ZGR2_HIBSY|nr:Ribulose bisphosphate carboxylase small chain 1A [Hibiscus syriacus]